MEYVQRMEDLARVPAALKMRFNWFRTQGIGSVSVPSPCVMTVSTVAFGE